MQDVVQLLGPLPFAAMTGSTSSLQIQEVICVGLGVTSSQLNSFFQPLRADLAGISREKLGVDLQQFFGLVDSSAYLRAVREVYVDRSVPSNLELIKSALYVHAVHKLKYFSPRISTLRSAMILIKLDSREYLLDGISLDRKHIHRVLRQSGLFLPDRLLEFWLHKYIQTDREIQQISPAEFVFLVANAKDREEVIGKLPYGERSLEREKETGLYRLDEAVTLRHSANPEQWMQREGNAAVNRSRITFYKDSSNSRQAAHSSKRKDRRKTIKERLEANLHALLANPQLHTEIQSTLQQYTKLLPASRAQISTSYSQRKAQEVIFTPVIDMIHLSDGEKRRRQAFQRRVQSLGSSGSLIGESEGGRTGSRPVSGTVRPVFGGGSARPASAKPNSMQAVQEPTPPTFLTPKKRSNSVDRQLKESPKRLRPRWML